MTSSIVIGQYSKHGLSACLVVWVAATFSRLEWQGIEMIGHTPLDSWIEWNLECRQPAKSRADKESGMEQSSRFPKAPSSPSLSDKFSLIGHFI